MEARYANTASSNQLQPTCLATAKNNRLVGNDCLITASRYKDQFFTSAEWSADGTTILCTGSLSGQKCFILPPDLLEKADGYLLAPYSEIASAEPIYSSAIWPGYSLSDLSTTLAVVSVRDHPIKLSNVVSTTAVSTYPLINSNTEAFIAPHSVAFSHAGARLITGSDSLIAIFDLSRNGDGPMRWLPTIPSKRKTIVGGGVGMKGIVSTLDTSCERLLAAGTFSRNVGIYADDGDGDVVTVFSLKGDDMGVQSGAGITQVQWSECGRYLFVAERMSDVILLYDIRVLGKRLATLAGRDALTNQRMTMEIIRSRGQYEVWAGSLGGVVHVWEAAEANDGQSWPDLEWNAHDDVVSSIGMHPYSNIAATCSGQRYTNSHPPQELSATGLETDAKTDMEISSSTGFRLEPNMSQRKYYKEDGLKIWQLQERGQDI